MPSVTPYHNASGCVEHWRALVENTKFSASGAPPQFHLSLLNNQIVVRLRLFDTALTRINSELANTAKRLHALNGRNPMQVVMQHDKRNFILGLLKAGAEWTVAPALRNAIQAPVARIQRHPCARQKSSAPFIEE